MVQVKFQVYETDMHLILLLIIAVNAFPKPRTSSDVVDGGLKQQKLAEEFNAVTVTTNGLDDGLKKLRNPKQSFAFSDYITEGLLGEVSLLDETIPKFDEFAAVAEKLRDNAELVTSSLLQEEISPLFEEDVLLSTEAIPSSNISRNYHSENVTQVATTNKTNNTDAGVKSVKNVRKESDFGNEIEEFELADKAETTTEKAEGNGKQVTNESQEEESSEEEEDFVQGLVAQFLGGLSTPEGGVDVDAIVGLIGGLSIPRGDGTYDFTGLTETLQSFFGGGDEDGGGGSDVGVFVGSLLSAIIQGVAKPPGAKGAGILSGQLLTGILPGLSAPPPPPEGSTLKPDQPLDSAGFFQGLFKSVLSGSNGANNKNQTKNGWNGNGNGKPMSNVKYSIIKAVFTLISSILSGFSKYKQGGWK